MNPDTFIVKVDLKPAGQVHPDRVAQAALISDPAMRLALSISAERKNSSNEVVTHYLKVLAGKDDSQTKRINTMVDWLDGEDEEDMSKTRRFFPKSKTNKREKDVFT